MSVIVVEIDTRKGPYKTSFDSKPEDNNEQAKQFWKTLLLHPHIESSLYSKEISQVVKLNPLKETRIDNSRKPRQPDPKTVEYFEKVKHQYQVDEVKKIQNQIAKINEIKTMKSKIRESFNSRDYFSKSVLRKSDERNFTNQSTEVIQDLEEFETPIDENEEIELVRNVDYDEEYKLEDDD